MSSPAFYDGSDVEKAPIYSDTEQYKNYRGPTSERSAGDCLFLLFFLAFWSSIVVVAVMGLRAGDPAKLGKAVDYKGNMCGVMNFKGDDVTYDMRSRPYLYHLNSSNLTSGVCLSSCPRLADDLVCTYPYQTKATSEKVALKDKECFNAMRTRVVLGLCFPTRPEKAGSIDNAISDSLWDQLLADTQLGFDYIVFAFVLSLLLGLIYLVMLRWMTYFIIVCTMVGSVLITACLAYYMYDDGVTRMRVKHTLFEHRRNMPRRDIGIAITSYILGLMGIIWSAALIMSIAFKARYLTVATGLIKMSSRCLSDLLSLFLWPLLCSFLILGGLSFWDSASMYVVTAGDASLYHTAFFIFLALVWGCSFILATSYTVVSGTVASWYFVRDKKALSHVLWKSFWRTIGLHLGSMALGSLILPPVSVYRHFINLFKKKISRESNPCTRALLGFWNCCLNCAELCLKYVDKGAYVQIALHGDSFVTSGQRAFSLYARSMPRLASVKSHGNFYLFLCRYFITVTTGLVGWIWMTNDFKDQMSSPLFPVLILMVGTYSVASLFIGVVDAAIETVLQCYCEDMERSKGGSDGYATADQQSFLGGAESPTFGGGYANYGT